MINLYTLLERYAKMKCHLVPFIAHERELWAFFHKFYKKLGNYQSRKQKKMKILKISYYNSIKSFNKIGKSFLCPIMNGISVYHGV